MQGLVKSLHNWDTVAESHSHALMAEPLLSLLGKGVDSHPVWRARLRVGALASLDRAMWKHADGCMRVTRAWNSAEFTASLSADKLALVE
eukprot:15480981-Alexandrium_andersonii.AAC.1